MIDIRVTCRYSFPRKVGERLDNGYVFHLRFEVDRSLRRFDLLERIVGVFLLFFPFPNLGHPFLHLNSTALSSTNSKLPLSFWPSLSSICMSSPTCFEAAARRAVPMRQGGLTSRE